MREIFETETERESEQLDLALMSTDVFVQRYCTGYFENAVILKMGALRINSEHELSLFKIFL